MTKKLDFATSAVGAATRLAQIRNDIQQLADTYLDRKYQAAGDNAIVDADVESLGITAAQLASFISTFASRFNILMTNQAVASPVDGDAIVNTLRVDL